MKTFKATLLAAIASLFVNAMLAVDVVAGPGLGPLP